MGRKETRKYDEDFSNSILESFKKYEEEKSWKPLKKSSSCNLSCGHHHIIKIIIIITIFNHCIKNFFKKLNPDDTRTRSTRKRRVPGGPVMTYSTTAKIDVIRYVSYSFYIFIYIF